MINKEKSPLFGRLWITRRISRKRKRRTETNLPFSKIVVKDNNLLKSPERKK
jgi:hypothetical protein